MAQEIEHSGGNAESPMAGRATAVKDRATEQAGELTQTVKDQAGNLAGEAVEQGRAVVERARQQLLEQGRERTGEAARALREFSGELSALADGRPQDAPHVAGYARSIAQQTGEIAQRLESESLDGLLTDMTRFARRRPAMFLVAAGAAGFIIGRAARSGAMSSGTGSPAGTSDGSHPSPYANGPGAAPGVSGNPEAARVAELSYDPRLDDDAASAAQTPAPGAGPSAPGAPR